MTFNHRSRLALVIVVLGLVGAGLRAQSERSDEASVKGAYLISFMKFSRWAPEAWPAKNGAVTIGVVGDTALLQALSSQSGTFVQGHPVRVRQVERIEDATACQVLFVGRAPATGVDLWAPELARAGVLTVSDRPEDGGTMVITLVPVGDRLAFDVDLDAARQARLELDSQLLRIARKVQGGPRSPR
jgi:hypothetical protein